jgi:uncharacterized protein with NRDE domain
MCLIAFAHHHRARYPLIVVANRDEFYARPTKPAEFWDDDDRVLAGRDLKYGGTWMGITRNGRFAAVTNYRETGAHRDHALSRGLMVSDFLLSCESPERFLQQVSGKKNKYNGFNLIIGDLSRLFYFSNRKNGPEEIEAGIHTLSNHLLDTPWPKSVRSREALFRVVEDNPELSHGPLMEILLDRTVSDDGLPDTGFGQKWERILSPIFITSDKYGTRNSTIITADSRGYVSFIERSFHYPGDPGREVVHEFELDMRM